MTEFAAEELNTNLDTDHDVDPAIVSETSPPRVGWADPYIGRISIADPTIKQEMIAFMERAHNPPYFVNLELARQQQAIRERLGD